MKTEVDFTRRNNSLGEHSLKAQAKASARRERSVGTLAADLKRAFLEEQRKQRKVRVDDSRKRKNQTLKDKLAESIMMDYTNVEPSKISYNALNLKYSQFQDKTNLGWRTERAAKDFSIKKNTHDWLMLKERLNHTKKKSIATETRLEPMQHDGDVSPEDIAKQAKIALLSDISKVERDAVKWLGEDGR